MDLVSTVRKEGSRGGRGDFQWSDVQTSTHRESYLGHSLMAPVGRWQKGRDLNWYARGDDSRDDDGNGEETAAEKAARERKEEIERVKEAEQEAMARALGFDVPSKSNANLQPIGEGREKTEMQKVVRAGVTQEADAKGVGYGAFGGGPAGRNQNAIETLAGSEVNNQPRKRYDVEAPTRKEKDSDRDRDRRRHRSGRSRSRSRRRDERYRHRRDRERYDGDTTRRDRRGSRSIDREPRAGHRKRYRTPSRSRSSSRSGGREHYRRRDYREGNERRLRSRSRDYRRRDERRSRSRSRDYRKHRQRSLSPDPRDSDRRPQRDGRDRKSHGSHDPNRQKDTSRDDRYYERRR